MREILYRGKRVDNGEWVYGVPWGKYMICGIETGYYDDDVPMSEYTLFDYCEIIPETVGQYTGLEDKNDKEIFEGDILRHNYYDREKQMHEQAIELVKYDKNTYDYGGLCYGFDINGFWGDDYFVIGDIHDNPELLNEPE